MKRMSKVVRLLLTGSMLMALNYSPNVLAFVGEFNKVGCTTCHTTNGAPWFTGGTPAPSHQTHAGTRFIACLTCHVTPLPATPLTSICGTCHINKLNNGILATQHAAKGVTSCQGCHQPAGGTPPTSTTSTTSSVPTTTSVGSTPTTTVPVAATFAAGCGVGCHAMPVNTGSTAYSYPAVNACSASFPAKFGSMGAYSVMSAAQVEAAVNAVCGGGGTTPTSAVPTTTSTVSVPTTTSVGSTPTTTVPVAASFAAGCGVGCHAMPVNTGNTAYSYPAVNACSASFPAKFGSMGAYSGMSAAQVQAAVNAVCGGGGTVTTSSGTTTTGTTTSTTVATGGAALFNSYCAACHTGAATMGGGRQVGGARTCSITASITGMKNVFPTGVPAMAFLKGLLTSTQVQQIADHLNASPVTSQQRYITACAGCHGIDARGGRVGENVRGESGSSTQSAIRGNDGGMGYLSCLPYSDLTSIGNYLQGRAETTTTTRSSTTTTRSTTSTTRRYNPPATHTVSQHGYLHMPGFKYPYQYGCTTCHGATLQGGFAPSCYTCHGKKW